MGTRFYFRHPESYSPLLRGFIGSIACISLLSPIFSFVLWQLFHIAGPQLWLPLSYAGIKAHFYWQFASYIFVHNASQEFSLSLLLSVTLHCWLLHFTGSEIISRLRNREFLLLIFSNVIVSGAAAGAYLLLTKSAIPFYGTTPLVTAFILLWGMLHPHLELSLFFVWRVTASKLVETGLALALIFLLIQGFFATAFATLAALLVTFLLGTRCWDLPNPYFPEWKPPSFKGGKIIDISQFQRPKESDEDFLDRILDKINRQGIQSLTEKERTRLERLSKRK